MELFKGDTRFDFMGGRRIATILSLLLIAVSIGSLATRGLNFGVDFTGGLLVEAGYPDDADLDGIRNTLAAAGYASPTVQNFGTSRDVLIRLAPGAAGEGEEAAGGTVSSTAGDEVFAALKSENPGVQLRRVEFVGPQVGEELRERGGLAMIFALLMILAYVAIRFQWKFGPGAVAALIHDVLLVVGFFSITQFTFDLNVLAALLAVIGYSLNDTIVVYDRIRENFRRIRRKGAEEIMNISINQMLGRTLVTSLTTLLVLAVLLWLGGEAVFGFSLALIVGIVVGTYSSIYVASATALYLDVTPQDLIPAERDREVDALP